MAPGSDERHPPPPPSHTGTVPKTKIRNCVVPQEAVTPTRRDINSANLASGSLDWTSVPVSEYNQRQNYTQSSRKATNSSAEHDFSDLDTSISLESALQRFVPVRPQPRGLPLPPMQPTDHSEEALNPYHQATPNGVSPHANHGAAAVMIVNPTTPNTLTGNMTHQYNVSSNTNRNNLARSLHTSRNSDIAGTSQSLPSQHQRAQTSQQPRGAAKANNINTNVYEQPHGSHRTDVVVHMNGGGPACTGEGARALNEAMGTACPDPASVERRLGQIREYIRVTSSLVDTMRNSEDEEVSDRTSTERAAKFCKLLDRLELSEAPDMATNSLTHMPINYHEARPMSVQSTGSAYSDSELWQSELKNKMEVSQQRLTALQDQQKRLLKYQAEAKQHLADMQSLARSRQSQDNLQNQSTPPLDNTHAQNQLFPANQQQSHRVYNSNQIGVATTLPQTNHASNIHSTSMQEGYRPGSTAEADSTSHGHAAHHQDDRFTLRNTAMLPHVEDPQSEDDEVGGSAQEMQLTSQGLELQNKLRDLQRKKQHMENLVAEFQKLQAAERLLGGGGGDSNIAGGGGKDSHNTYSSDDSGAEDMTPHNSMKADANMKNEDPFKLMEISAIKAALQKTKDLMRTVERYEPPDSGLNEDFQLSHSNINDNKSEGGRSTGEWSTEGSVCRSIHNAIQPGKLNKHANRAHASGGASGSGTHEASISSLQILAQQLRQEAENIASERQRLQQSVQRTNKDGGGKLSKKKLLRGTGPGGTPPSVRGGGGRLSPGPLERKQQALRAELAEKQRQLEMILSKEKELSSTSDVHKIKEESCSYSAMNQSYNSEQEGDSQTEDVLFPTHTHSQTEHRLYQSAEESVYGEEGGSVRGTLPPHMHPAPAPGPPASYYSDSDNGSRCKSDTRSLRGRRNRAVPPERTIHEHVGVSSSMLAEPPPPAPHVLHTQLGESSSSTPTYPPPLAPPAHAAWGNKSNQDARSNQFTQNSHSQTTMERLLGMQLPYPPALQPFNMMMPLGAFQGGGGACGCWGPWCWQQLAAQQREIHQLRDQLNSLEERWRSESTPHALNNQVPPGNRANNYWDNFRSYSRQNLLSSNSKTNADGHLGSVPPHNPHPLVARSHNTLHTSPAPPAPVATPPAHTPKRNTNRHNFAYDTQHSLISAPDVLNVNQRTDQELGHVNINRETSLDERNLNLAEPVPEIIQAHSNNLNRTPDSLNSKMKSSSKLPAKNSTSRRNYSLDYVQNGNINIASTSEAPNPNLASMSRDKATKMFDMLRENVYSEVTALISANESHPDFLIQLFRELQNVSSDSLRQNALQSIRNLLSNNIQQDVNVVSTEAASNMVASNLVTEEAFTNSVLFTTGRDGGPIIYRDIIDFMIARGEEICTSDLLESFKSVIINSYLEASQSMPYSHKRLQELLSKYEGVQLREVSGDIIDDLLSVPAGVEEAGRRGGEMSEAAGQHVNSGDSQGTAAGYSGWVGGNTEAVAGRPVDLIECAEMYNGDLAEADQTCSNEPEPPMSAHDTGDLLPDLVETEEITPTEAEAEWLGLDRVPTRLHMEDSPANQKD